MVIGMPDDPFHYSAKAFNGINKTRLLFRAGCLGKTCWPMGLRCGKAAAATPLSNFIHASTSGKSSCLPKWRGASHPAAIHDAIIDLAPAGQNFGC
jgi:hypothetical protein